MTFWIVAAVLAVAVAAAVALPLLRRAPAPALRSGEHDVAVYRQQLATLDHQTAGGTIAPEEAAVQRTEIARRLLDADRRRTTASDRPERRWTRPAGAVLLVALPVAALAIYLGVGAPGMPDMPLAGRAPANGPTAAEVAGAVDRLAAHLAENPDDLQGWVLLGRAHFAEQRFAASAAAWARAAALAPDDGELRATLGQTLTVAANGQVTSEARLAFVAALERLPGDPRARYYLALADWQAGRRDEALAAWQALLAEAPPEAPWRAAVATRIAEAGGEVPPPSAAQPPAPAHGPSEADVAAAAQMAPEERRQMIEGMVAALAARLDQNPSDVAGWLRLANAYVVLGRRDDAEAALRRALAADAGSVEALVRLAELVAARVASDEARALFERARNAVPPGSPAAAEVERAARAVLGAAP